MLKYDWIPILYATALVFLAGASGGSFINCLCLRMVRGESVVKGRSRCPDCGKVLGVWDLIPVYSWIRLRGRCSGCKKPISSRYLWTEVLMGMVAVSLFVRYGFLLRMMFYFVFACILLGESLVDLDTYEIPDGFHLAALLWWCFWIPFSGKPVAVVLKEGVWGGAAIAGGMVLFTLVLDWILGKESMGGADIKLFFVTGLYLGWRGNFLNLMVSCMIGLIFAALFFRDSGRKEEPSLIPFAPSIALGTWFCLLFGDRILDWYMGFFR